MEVEVGYRLADEERDSIFHFGQANLHLMCPTRDALKQQSKTRIFQGHSFNFFDPPGEDSMQMGISIFFYSLLLILVCIAPSAALHLCKHANYTSATFESNLNKVLENLANNTSSSKGFNTSVSGQSPDRVYGLLQCWGDSTVEDCFSCSQEAISSIRQDCGNVVGGKAWLDKCFIRYENFSFFGRLDTETNVGYSSAKVTVNPEVISTAVNGIFRNLSYEALRSPRRYSSASVTTSTSYKISSLVQCWSDLTSVEDCRKCLTNAISFLLDVTQDGTFQKAVAGSGSCVAQYERNTLFDIRAPPPPLQLPSPPSSSPTPKKSSNKTTIMTIVISILGALMMLLLCLLGVILYNSTVLSQENRGTEAVSTIGHEQAIIFNLENIMIATRNFHDDNKLGQGGFGPVYKGTMPDGKQIAVKKLSLGSLQGKKEFLNEVKLVVEIQHRNLVNLLGCCAEGLERLLVYEFLPNKSLDKILFNPERRKELDWKRRLNIILGVARGLLYLHEDSQLPIIHRDIKASNILLDEKLEPKISDFGLARLFRRDETHVNTRVAGTYGYMAPEYAMLGQLSIKADVYSFGIVILEIICGRKNADIDLSPEFQSLLEWVWRSYRGGNIVDVIDRTIIKDFSNEEVSRCIHVGLLCTQANASLRPPMASVYAMLLNLSVTNLPDPTKPAFLNLTQKYDSSHTSTPTSTIRVGNTTSSTSCPSINEASVTDLGPR